MSAHQAVQSAGRSYHVFPSNRPAPSRYDRWLARACRRPLRCASAEPSLPTACRSPRSPRASARRVTSTAPPRFVTRTRGWTPHLAGTRTPSITRSRPIPRSRSSGCSRTLAPAPTPIRWARSTSRCAAGFTPEQIMFTGVGKSADELSRAIALGLKAINVESPGELDRLDPLAAGAADRRPRRAARQSRHRRAQPPAHLDRPQDQQVRRAHRCARRRSSARSAGAAGLEAVGVHSHIGSQITALDPLLARRPAAVDLAAALRAEGVPLRHVDFGGGVGISYDGTPAIDSAEYGRALVDLVRPSGLTALIEPGRVLVGPAGVLVTRVVDVKQFDGARQFVVLDAGMTELMRPALYGAFHRIEAGDAARGRADHRRHRRPGLREHRHVRARSGAAAGRGRRSHGACATSAPTVRRWGPRICAVRCRPRCSSTRAGGASFGAARRSTTC